MLRIPVGAPRSGLGVLGGQLFQGGLVDEVNLPKLTFPDPWPCSMPDKPFALAEPESAVRLVLSAATGSRARSQPWGLQQLVCSLMAPDRPGLVTRGCHCATLAGRDGLSPS